MSRHNSILDTIGNTPLVKLNRMAPSGVNVYVKIEAFNPMGSVKDRMARAVIEKAEASGELKPGMTVIEATSGNTGIGLAMACAQKGYPLVVTMAESFSIERRKLLRFLGAKVVLTPASEKGTGMLNKAVELAEKHGYYQCRQFENEANADIHTSTTAQEILEDFKDDTLDYWVSGFGTGGTLKGVARGLKADRPEIQVIAVEPDNSPILASGIPQPRDINGKVSKSHPNFRPHLMQGWSPDFISGLTESAMSESLIESIVPVNGDVAIEMSRRLAREEGIFCGISSGATLAGALQIAEQSKPGTNIVCMLPDTGERYLSTPLFGDIGEEMTEEELLLSNSTTGYRFDIQTPTGAVNNTQQQSVDVAAKQHFDEMLNTHKVLMFALEWCEFCWAVKKLFHALNIEFHSVDLDSVAYQQHDLGNNLRPVLLQNSGQPTIPQIYICGKNIGGASELFDAYRDGSLQQLLQQNHVAYDEQAKPQVAAMLPQWLQPRKSA